MKQIDLTQFTQAMDKIHRLIHDGFGENHPALEDMDEMMDVRFTEDGVEFDFIYRADAMFSLLRTLMNWDFFWVTDAGAVDVENANEQEIAALIAPYVTPEMALKVRESI